MLIHILAVVIIAAGLLVLPGNQLLPTILAQEDSLTESTTGNTTETSEDEDLQQNGTISRKAN